MADGTGPTTRRSAGAAMTTVLPDHVDAFLRAIVKPEQPIGVREVALLLGLHPHTVKRLSPEELPYFRVGSRGDRRYLSSDVRSYINVRAVRARVSPCECPSCHPCRYPSRPGAIINGLRICWRCKEGRCREEQHQSGEEK
jgi:hypothetical protein